MTPEKDEHTLEQEEAAQGHDLFRSPGEELLLEQARDQAEASGWIPGETVPTQPSDQLRGEVAARRQDFYDALRELEASIARPSGRPDWLSDVISALTGLGDTLERHIAQVEGANGLFDDIMASTPRLSAEISGLRQEHHTLTTSWQRAWEMANADTDPDPDILRRRINALLGRLAIHRQRGSELVFDAYNLDVGTAG
jgi:hypothetical protein